MKRSLIALAALLALLFWICGCSTGGGASGAATPRQVLSTAQSELESVTTNLSLNPDTATTILRSASRNFSTVLQSDPNNAQAKFGYALSNTMEGFFDLSSVLPKSMKTMVVNAITASRTRGEAETPLSTVLTLAEHALRTDSRATVREVQLRIASRTLGNAKNVLVYYDQLETAVNGGGDLSLRLYFGGRIRTVALSINDLKLVSAFARLTAALLHLSVAYNLEMTGGTPVRPLPVDSNNNGLLEANEYLIGYPFLEKSNGTYLAQFINYLRQACDKASEGADLQGHSTGDTAFLDVTNAATKKMLFRLDYYSTALSIACSSTVSTDSIFGDHTVRTLDMAKVAQISDIRGLMPSFQKDDLTAPGIWPDPTFKGVVTPGIPQGFVKLYYRQFESAY